MCAPDWFFAPWLGASRAIVSVIERGLLCCVTTGVGSCAPMPVERPIATMVVLVPCDTAGMTALQPEIARLEDAVANLMGLRDEVEAGAPWPLADVWGVEPEASWGPPELLAHVEEYLRYWMGEIERVLDGNGT